MLGHIRVGAGDKEAPSGPVSHRCPHFLTAHRPSVRDSLGSGAKPGDVAASAGLTEELAPHLFTREQRTKVALTLLGSTPCHNCRSTHSVTDGIESRHVRATGSRYKVVDERLQTYVGTESAHTKWMVDPGQTTVELSTEKLFVAALLRGKVLDQLVNHRLDTVLAKVFTHYATPRSSTPTGTLNDPPGNGLISRTMAAPTTSSSGRQSTTRTTRRGRGIASCTSPTSTIATQNGGS